MKKKILSTCLAFVFSMSIAGVSLASTKCMGKITAVEGTVLTIDCGSKAKKFKVGEKVQVKKKRAHQVEGC